MKRSLSTIVLGLSTSLLGCIVEKDLRSLYSNNNDENVSGKVADIDEDSFFDHFKKYPVLFEILRIKTTQGIKKVLIPHPTSYTIGDNFSEPCKKIEKGIVRFSDLVVYSGVFNPETVIQKGSIRTDYLFLEDMYYEPKK